MSANKDGRPRVAFLFGAGASIPAGMPSTREITERVLSGENVSRRHPGQYFFGSSPYPDMGEYVPKVKVLLNLFHCIALKQYEQHAERRVNYETLYSLVSQVYDDAVGEYDNPALLPFQRLISRAVLPKIRENNASSHRTWSLLKLTRETRNYIHDVVAAMLRNNYFSTDYLSWLVEACSDETVDTSWILTLNHDTVLEECLSDADISITDGFDKRIRDISLWNPALFDPPNSRKLIKIHGSVNWYAYPASDSPGVTIYAKVFTSDVYHTSLERFPRENRPLILIGTISKLLRYTSVLFSELQFQAQSALRASNILVVVGYSFGDKGINNHIFDFLFRSPKTKLIIIHNNFKSLCAKALPAMQRSLPKYKTKGRVRLIKKRVEEVTWQEIKDVIKP